MTELERRKQRKEEMMKFRLKRIECAKKIIIQCQKFIDAEEQLMKETDREQKNKLHNTKSGAKAALLIRFEEFKKKFEY